MAAESFMHHPANDRFVPIAAPHDAIFSVSFGEISWLGMGKFLNFGFCRSHQQ